MFTCVVLTLLSSSCATVFAGRWLMSFWTGTAKIHELYTAACGLYVCWLSIRAVTVLLAWMPQGRRVILLKVQEWTLMVQYNYVVVGKVVGTTPVHTPGRNVSACKMVLMAKIHKNYRLVTFTAEADSPFVMSLENFINPNDADFPS